LELLNQAESILNEPLTNPVAQKWRTRVLELGEGLFQSIHMQLAVERYRAEAVSRAANLDTLDAPLNDAAWLKERFAKIRALTSYAERCRAIEEIMDRTNPGPGGFYDNPETCRASGIWSLVWARLRTRSSELPHWLDTAIRNGRERRFQ
jgi:hypothetical protein